MAELKFIITADNSGMMQTLQETQNAMRTTARNVEQIGQLLDLQEFRDASASVTDFANKLYEASQESVGNLSSMSQQFRAQAESIRSEMESMLGGGSMDGMAEKLDAYKQAVMDASAAAETAYNVQGVAVATLAEELDSLQQAQEAALSAGDSGTAQALQGDIDALSGTLQQAQEQLTQLGAQADAANQQLNNLDATFAQFGGNAQNVGSAFDTIKGKIGEATEATKNWLTGNGKFTEGINSMKDALGGMGGAFTPAIAGAKKMLVALRAMIATPIGAVLTAVVVALQAMHKWFTKSAEGQRAFAKVSAFISSVLSSLTDIAVAVGKYLFRAFSDPNKSLGTFARNLVTTFSNALKSVYHLVKSLASSLSSLGTIVKGIATLDLDTISKGWDNLKNAGSLMMQAFGEAQRAAKGAFSTIVSGFKAVGEVATDIFDNASFSGFEKWANGVISKAKTSMELAGQQVDQTVKLQEAQAKQAEYDKQIGEQYEKLYKLKGKERQDAINELKELQKVKYNDMIAAQTQLYEITKKNNSLHSSTLEDLQHERDLRVQMLQTQAQQANSTRMLARMEAANERQMASTAAKAAKGGGRTVAIDLKAVREAEAALAELERKQDNERISQQVAMEERLTAARIAAMKDGADKVTAEREQENKAELLQLAEQLKAAKEAEYQRQKARYEAEQKLKPTNERKPWEATMLDQSEIDKIVAQYEELAELIKQKQQQIIEGESQSAMRDFLRNYGTYQERRLAIAEEYAEKIAKATTDGERKALEKQRDEAISQLDFTQLQKDMNWSVIFGDLNRVATGELKEVRAQLQMLKKDANYYKRNPDQIKVIEEAINRINAELAEKGGLFGGLVDSFREYEAAVRSVTDAEEQLKNAVTEEEKERARLALTTARQNLNSASVTKDKAVDATIGKTKKLMGVITELGNTEEMSVAQLGSLIANVTDTFSEAAGKIGGIIGSILALLDSIGNQNIDEWAKGIANRLFTAVGQAFNSKYSLLHYVAGDLMGASNDLEEDIPKLVNANNDLEAAIRANTKALEDSSIADIGSVYNNAIKLMNEREKNMRSIMQETGSTYSQGFLGLGGKHSAYSYINDALSTADWARISKIVGKNISGAGGFFYLSSEDMKKVQEQATDLYTKIKNAGEDGYAGIAEYMDEYITYFEEFSDLQSKYFEKLTSVSLDSVVSDFKSALSDMDSSTRDFADKFEDYMRNAIINALVTNQFEPMIKDWYEAFAKAVETNGIDEAEQRALRQQWDYITEQGLKLRDQIRDQFGLGSSGEGSGAYKAASSFSQEQGDELNGRLTAIQIGQAQSNEQLTMAVMTLQSLSIVATTNGNTLAEMRNLMLIGNGHLEDIARYTRIAAQYGTAIETIAEKIKTL